MLPPVQKNNQKYNLHYAQNLNFVDLTKTQKSNLENETLFICQIWQKMILRQR